MHRSNNISLKTPLESTIMNFLLLVASTVLMYLTCQKYYQTDNMKYVLFNCIDADF